MNLIQKEGKRWKLLYNPLTGRTTGPARYDPSISTDKPVSKSTFKDGKRTSKN